MRNGKSKLGVGIVGMGGRGRGIMGLLLCMDDVEVISVCDLYPDRVEESRNIAAKAGKPVPAGYSDYKRAIRHEGVDCVIVTSSWYSHTEILIAAMRAGKPAATEVGGASSLEECWALVRAEAETSVPCMMLENCCYGREEMAVLNIARLGLFGEIIHCQGGYHHDLRKPIATGVENRYDRVYDHSMRNGELYPTHELGPIAKLLDINRGNRFLSLCSMSSKARGINQWARENLTPGHPAASLDFKLGDVVTTILKCARGETVVLTHDTSLPRPYSRGGYVQGTRGIWMEDGRSIYIEGRSHTEKWEPFDPYMQEFEHPLWKDSMIRDSIFGHGGMDVLVYRAFIECVRDELEMPVDALDTASWRAVTVLSEQSAAMGGMPVPFPDFSEGKWMTRGPVRSGKYSI